MFYISLRIHFPSTVQEPLCCPFEEKPRIPKNMHYVGKQFAKLLNDFKGLGAAVDVLTV